MFGGSGNHMNFISHVPPLTDRLHPIENVVSHSSGGLKQDPSWAPSIYIGENGLSYSDFLEAVRTGNVVQVIITPNMSVAKVTVMIEGKTQDMKVIFPEDYDIVNFLLSYKVNVVISDAKSIFETRDGSGSGNGNIVEKISRGSMTVLQIAFQVAFIAMIFNFFRAARNGGMGGGGGGGGGGGLFGMTSSRATLFESDMISSRFSDVAGAENAKRELTEIVDFLKNPEKYTKLGARIPKGILLYGPPGCGKTLLARSVAGEAGVPFFSTAGSSMVELFVGVAAARIRDMFRQAKDKSPCIIFIDEIDAIGKARGMNLNSGGNDERDQALNQLLTEMDGFDVNHGVIVIAATNRPDILDEALTRPGRFDRRVAVEYPDLHGRTEILRVHTRGMPLGSDIELRKLAKNTIGFTGADLKNLCNEAAIYAARDEQDLVQDIHFDKALEKLTMGEAHTTSLVSEQKRKIVAYHEAGHTLLGLLVSDFDIVRKVSIIPRGNAGGITYFEPSEDRIDGSLMSREYLENRLVVALGGRVAEEIIFGYNKVTTGASGDFQMVTEMATDMVCKYGFNNNIGPMYVDEEKAGQYDIQSEVMRHVDRAHERATDLIREHEFHLHRIAEALLEKETLHEDDLRQITKGLLCNIAEDLE